MALMASQQFRRPFDVPINSASLRNGLLATRQRKQVGRKLGPFFLHKNRNSSIYHCNLHFIHSFQNRELYADPAAIYPSALLLFLILGLSFNRIFGLDRFAAQTFL